MVNATNTTSSPSGSSTGNNNTPSVEPALYPILINYNYNHSTPKIFHGGIGLAPGNGGVFTSPGAGVIGQGKFCIDLHERKIPSGVHYVPGPDECTLCVCEDGGPKWCKAVLCSPPQDCHSFRVGNSCCEFICLDDTLNKKGSGGKTGGPFNGPLDLGDVVPKIIVVAITAILSLSLLLFLIHRLRQKQIQGRLNSSVARRCDDCDENRSLDFSMDYFVDRGPNHPPPYLAWWKPPSTYFPPRGEAPPPYEEAIASTSNCLPSTFTAAYANANPVNITNVTQSNGAISTNGIATTSLIVTPAGESEDSSTQANVSEGKESTGIKRSQRKKAEDQSKQNNSNSSKKRNFKSISSGSNSVLAGSTGIGSDPQPGPSSSTRRRLNETEIVNGGSRINHPVIGAHGSVGSVLPLHLHPRYMQMQVPPAYDDSIMQLPLYGREPYFRHSLSLPRRGEYHLDNPTGREPFCPRIGTSSNNNGGQVRSDSSNRTNHQQQRYSLQFHIADHCWSSASSSTLSLSTPNSPNGISVRPPSLSSSSSSNVSNTHV